MNSSPHGPLRNSFLILLANAVFSVILAFFIACICDFTHCLQQNNGKRKQNVTVSKESKNSRILILHNTSFATLYH
jgi:hypothetical protein